MGGFGGASNSRGRGSGAGTDDAGAGGTGADRAVRRLVERLRTAGCVFAEEEAMILLERAAGDARLLEELTRRRAAGAPLEALVGWVDFGGLRLSVGPGVFVPRQRTLELARRAASELRARAESRADAGSAPPLLIEAFAGVAPVAAHVRVAVPGAHVVACERDEAALQHAERNLRVASPGGRAGEVHRTDVLDGLPRELRRRADVIAAVPPYVPDPQFELLPHEARDHEPTSALTGGADGLRWVRALIEQAGDWLAPGGRLLIEMHRDQRPEAERCARLAGLAPRDREAGSVASTLADAEAEPTDVEAERAGGEAHTIVLGLSAVGAASRR